MVSEPAIPMVDSHNVRNNLVVALTACLADRAGLAVRGGLDETVEKAAG